MRGLGGYIRRKPNGLHVTDAIPARPFTRVRGSLDVFVAALDMPHIENEAAPGVTVETRGWIVDSEHDAVERAWIDIGGVTIGVRLEQSRLDVARSLTARDREGRGMGFQTKVTLPDDVPVGQHEVRVIARTRAGRGVYATTAQRVSIAHPRCAPRTFTPLDGEIKFGARIRDTQTAAHTLGRGAHTIRQESSLRVSGFVADAFRLHVQATAAAGEPVAWEFACDKAGRFDATLWTGDLERGFYELTLGRIDGEMVTKVARWGIEIAGPHYLPPLHLTALLQQPISAIDFFGDSGPQHADDAPAAFVAGRPIGISGWCLDAAAHAPPLAVYAAIDEKRPIPLSHHLLDPRPDHEPAASRCGFGGIIDTTRLEPGEHRLRILAAAVSGAGWYLIDERALVLT